MDLLRSSPAEIPRSTMVDNQKQSANNGSMAVQAGGPVSINTGMTSAQMAEILSALAIHVETLGRHGKEAIENRLREFESSIIERFANDAAAQTEAFLEPDFLAATLDAQRAYARSGDSDLRDVLIDLIVQRSKNKDRSRLSLTLNDAIQKVGSIPQADLNAMSLMFVFQNAQSQGIGNLAQLAAFLASLAVPISKDISSSKSAFDYLSAHGCVVTSPGIITYPSAMQIILDRYGAAVAKGLPEASMRSAFSNYDALMCVGLVVDSPYGGELKTFSYCGPDLDKRLAERLILGDYYERYRSLTKDFLPSEEEFIGAISEMLPEAQQILNAYDAPPLRNTSLTSIGIALAHANLARGPLREVDLSIWIHP